MHLTRAGFNIVVAAYLLPLVIVDFVGNTTSTGSDSDYYYIKFIFDALLLAYALYQVFFAASTASVQTAQLRKADHEDEVVDFEHLGAFQYIYVGTLSLYSAVNFYFLHLINKSSTGMISSVSLVWSFLSLGICVLAAIQFYHLKSGKIVELKKKIIQ